MLNAIVLKRPSRVASNYPASNTAATFTIAGVPGKRIVIENIFASYSAAPTNGKLTITCGSDTIEVDIIAGGPLPMPMSHSGLLGQSVAVTLAAGGVGITGKLACTYYTATLDDFFQSGDLP